MRARSHLRALMTQKSCAVGMCNVKLGNHLNAYSLGKYFLAPIPHSYQIQEGSLYKNVNSCIQNTIPLDLLRVRGEKHFKPRPRILVPLRGSQQNFRRAPPSSLYKRDGEGWISLLNNHWSRDRFTMAIVLTKKSARLSCVHLNC